MLYISIRETRWKFGVNDKEFSWIYFMLYLIVCKVLYNWRFSQRCLWRLLSSGIQRQVSSLNMNLRFIRTSRLRFRGRRRSQEIRMRQVTSWDLRICFSYCLLPYGPLLALLFDPEYGGDMFLRNIRSIPTDQMALYPRRQSSYVCLRTANIIEGK
jgi:hypothetical protein